MLRSIVTYPHPILSEKAKRVRFVDNDLRRLVEDMFETMYHSSGIGLAAVQIAEMRRVIVVDTSSDPEKKDPRALINPQLVWRSKEMNSHEEGCLSLPDVRFDVFRPARVRVHYMDLAGAPVEIEADGLLATCLQHEIDHLNGKLIIDHLPRRKRARILEAHAAA
jgi:peptide deformylase